MRDQRENVIVMETKTEIEGEAHAIYTKRHWRSAAEGLINNISY
jgi:hypothetical protein